MLSIIHVADATVLDGDVKRPAMRAFLFPLETGAD